MAEMAAESGGGGARALPRAARAVCVPARRGGGGGGGGGAAGRAPGTLRSAPGRTAVVAQSLQEPRTLDNYRELFGRGNRSGYLEINRVMRGSSPHASQWRRKYVELEDGVVYASDERDHAQERLVTIKEVTSVKTARSLESDTIISLSTPKECFYLHTADDAEMKDWLLSFHTTVINVLLVSNGSTRHIVAGRSQSGDMDDQPMVYASLDGNGSMGLARYGNSDGLRAWGGAGVAGSLPQPSGGPPFVTGLPTVDQLPGQTLHKSATRDFSVPVSLSTSPRDFPQEPRRASTTAAPLERTMLEVDSALAGLSPPALSTSPSRVPTSGAARRASFLAAHGPRMTESTKRVHEPPVEMDSRTGLELSSSFSSTGSNGHQHARRFQDSEHNYCYDHDSGFDSTSSVSSASSARDHNHHHHHHHHHQEATGPRENDLERSNAMSYWPPQSPKASTTSFSPRVAVPAEPPTSSGLSAALGTASRRDAPSTELKSEVAYDHLHSDGTPIPSAADAAFSGHNNDDAKDRVDKKEEEQAKASESAGAREKSSLASLLSSMSVSASGGGGVKSKYVPPHLRNKGNGNGGGGDLPPPEVHPYMSGDEDALGMFAMEGSGSRDQGEARGSEDESLATGTEQQAGSSENGKDNDESDGLHSNKAESQFFGRSAEQGCRATMEDFDVALPRLEEDKPLGFFAVYDGHCGTRVAELASQQLHKYAQEHEAIFEDWPRGARTATFDAFARLEREFFELATSREHPLRDGSCAIVLLVHYPETDSTRADGVAVANLGDSRAVLFNEGYVSDLSVEHSPARPDERARIEGVGGWVTVEREMLIEKLHRVDLDDPDIRERVKRRFNYVETSRVNGELAVSRALGDIDYKKPAQDEYQWFFPSTHEAAGKPSFVFGDDLVNSIPEWKHVELEAHASERGTSGANTLPLTEDLAQGPFVVLACDGLWDAITSEEAIEYCRTCHSPQQASDLLVEVALRMGTSDNVTALVVPLASDAFARPSIS